MIRLSQRDDKTIDIGDEFKFVSKYNSPADKLIIGDIIKIIEKNSNNTFDCKNLRNNNINNWGPSIILDIQYFKKITQTKPHEYSPVNMTGYYKTIGD